MGCDDSDVEVGDQQGYGGVFVDSTRPRSARRRRTVEGDTVIWWCCWRCQLMVWGPASRPWEDSSERRFTTNSTVSSRDLGW